MGRLDAPVTDPRCLSALLLRLAGQDPEVVAQNDPANHHLTIFYAFGPGFCAHEVSDQDGDSPGEGFHFAQDFVAMFATVFDAEFGGHFHAEGVDVAEKFEGFLGHAVTQSLTRYEEGGFHEGAGDVTQQNPVDGVVDGCPATIKIAP